MNLKNLKGFAGRMLGAVMSAVLVFSFYQSNAQIVLTTSSTASDLATSLAGTGVTIMSPVLTCASGATARFTTGAVDPIGVSSGIAIITGDVTAITSPASVGPESSFFTPSLSDPDLAAIAAGPTNDACVLEFDFKAVGDTIRFEYVFASEEYPEFACSEYNDVFAFFISGGVTSPLTSYPTPTNLARVPGTNIPVCINSVNSAPVGTGYPVSTCSSLGPGSPFNMYYVDNSASTMLVFDGKTTVLTAVAAVSPCDVYHLKMGIADVGDNAYNSGVFIKGGSLTSTVPDTIVSAGAGGTNYVIRGCGDGHFYISIPEEQDTDVVRHLNVLGTAVGGYDYTEIADSVIIPAHDTVATIDIHALLVPAAGPKVVTIQVLKEDPCHPGEFAVTGTASLTIIDSLGLRILTPDTSICAGSVVPLRAVGDTNFAMTYLWSPSDSVVSPTVLNTSTTPNVDATYSLTGTLVDTSLGCPAQVRSVHVSIFPNPVIAIDSPIIKTCLGVPVTMHAYVTPVGTAYTYNWAPALDISSTAVPTVTVTPTIMGDMTYTVTVYPTALPACVSTEMITVHTLPNDFTINTPDTAICLGEYVQVSVSGPSEFLWHWAPPTAVSDTTIMEPTITPTVSGTWSLTASYAHCPDMMHSIAIEVDTAAPLIVTYDTICLPMSFTKDLTVPTSTGIGEGYYHYQWVPGTFIANDTMPMQVITPTVAGAYVYTVTVQPHAASCAVNDIVSLYVLPNTINIVTPDTAVCLGKPVQIVATGHPLFEYQWLPTAGIAISDVVSPLVIPDTSAWYKVGVSFHLCPTFYDSIYIDVQPNPSVYVGGSRYVCEYDTIRLIADVTPAWYTHYSYNWAPGTHLDRTDERSAVLTGAANETIVLTVSTPAGCTGVDSAAIGVRPANFATLEPASWDFCPRDTLMLSPEGGASYQWSPSLYLDNDNAAQQVVRPITNQTYTIVATSIYGCKDTLFFSAMVYPGAVIYMEDSVTLHPGETYHIDPQTNCTSFSWTPSSSLSGKYLADPVASPEISTKYIVYAATEHGCKVVDSIKINVDEATIIDLPNAFTPGGNVNGEFKIIKRGIATLNYFRIFNRWGNLVFSTNNIDEGWNGEYKGVPQSTDVFVYQVEAVTSTGKIIRKQGNVTLLR